MGTTIKNNHPVVEEAIKNFFNKAEKEDFARILSGETSTRSVKLDAKVKDQIEFEISPGPQTRLQLDLLITYAETKYQPEKLIEFLIYLGQLTILAGENQVAIEIQEKIISLCNGKSGTEDIVANALLSLGEIHSRQANWELSVNYLEKAAQIFRDQHDIKGGIHCENIQGTIEGDHGNLEKAKAHFENALKALEGLNDSALVGKIEINLGIINNMQGNYDEALSYLKRALINFENLRDLKRIAEIKQNLGMVYTKKKEYSLAISEFDDSIDASIRSNYLQNLGITFVNKAYVYTNLKDFNFAEAFCNKAMEIAYRINDKLTIAEVHKIKGIISRNRKKFEAAENSLLSSLRLNKDLGNQLNLAETSWELGILYKQKGEMDKANKYLNEALGYFRKINSKADIEDLEKLIRS